MHSKNGKFLYFLRSRVPGKAMVILIIIVVAFLRQGLIVLF